MEREIKFRAWHKDFGEMVYTKGNSIFEKREFSPFVFEVGFSHYPESEWEIMQFTGLKDKTGKDIYEGDIISTPKGICAVTFELGCFYAITVSRYRLGGWNTDSIDVIGNVHENSELLTGRHEA